MEDETVNIITDGSDTEIEETQSTVEEPAVEEVEEKQVKKKLKLKKNWRTKFVSPSGIQISEIYCRRCVQYKNPKEFMKSYDTALDKSGMMSVCRTCCEEIYQDNLRSERDIQRALLKTCRTLNWVYYSPAIDTAIERVKSKTKSSDSPMPFTSAYWNILVLTNNLKFTDLPSFTFTEPAKEDFIPKELMDESIQQEIIDFWGEGFDTREYRELQKHYLEFKRDYKVEVKGEIFLVQQICYKILELDKARIRGDSTDGLLKEIQTMMKNSALTPAMANMANSGKALDTWGVRIATIQKEEPAEWLEGEEQRKKLENYFGDFSYFKNHFVRSLKNYMLGSKDYLSDDILGVSNEDEYESEDFVSEEEVNEKEESSTLREE